VNYTELVKYEIKIVGNDYPEIVYLGDTHIGSAGFDKKNFERAIKYIANNENRYMIGMGDFVDAITPLDRRFSYKEIDKKLMFIDEQYAYLEGKLEEIKDKIIGLHIGNHGSVYTQKTCFNEMKRICKRLDINFLDDTAVITIDLISRKNNLIKRWKIHTSHGYGGGYTLGAVVNRIIKEPGIISDASLHAMGHSHKLFCFPYLVGLTSKENKVKADYAWFINTGSFLKAYMKGVSGYAERKHYSPNPLGFAQSILRRKDIVCYVTVVDLHSVWD